MDPARGPALDRGSNVAANDHNEEHGLARARTDWAAKRTALANERTLAAWIRTGLATLATGYVIVKLGPQAHPRWLLEALGATLSVVAALMQAVALVTYIRTGKALPPPESKSALRFASALTIVVVLLTAVAGAFLIVA